jgi:hypothetical protein
MSLVGTIEPCEDIRKRGLAGTILTQERVNLTDAHLEGDVFVRNDSRKPLRNAKGSHCIRSDCPGAKHFRHLL